MLEELQTWWQSVTPEMQAAIQAGCVLVLALIGGHFLGKMVVRVLRSHNFDAALRLPGAAPAATEPERGITPTVVAGLLVRLTVWAGAAWWLAHQQGRSDITSTISLIVSRTWALATVLVAALALGSLLAHRLIECLQGPKAEASASRNGAAATQRSVAGAVGAGAYVLVTLVVLLIAADLFDWPLTRSSALALWQLAQHLLVAGGALFIGCLGARWARDMVTPEGAASPEKRAGQYTALGIVAATTVLAVAVMLSSAGVLIGLAALAVFGFLLWLVRGYLPDVAAGLQLRTHQVREVWLDGAPWQVTEVGFLTTQVGRAGEFHRLSNRLVLESRFQGAPLARDGAELTGARRS